MLFIQKNKPNLCSLSGKTSQISHRQDSEHSPCFVSILTPHGAIRFSVSDLVCRLASPILYRTKVVYVYCYVVADQSFIHKTIPMECHASQRWQLNCQFSLQQLQMTVSRGTQEFEPSAWFTCGLV